MSQAYDVGYGRPPETGKFTKGVSGNPMGRPKGSRNVSTEILEELNEKIEIREGGRIKGIKKRRALIKALVAKALKGDVKAASYLLDRDNEIDNAKRARQAELKLSKADEAIIAEFRKLFEDKKSE